MGTSMVVWRKRDDIVVHAGPGNAYLERGDKGVGVGARNGNVIELAGLHIAGGVKAADVAEARGRHAAVRALLCGKEGRRSRWVRGAMEGQWRRRRVCADVRETRAAVCRD